MRCRRYYQRFPLLGDGGGTIALFGQRYTTRSIDIPYNLPVAMRASPTLGSSGFTWVSAPPTGNQVAFYDQGSSTWLSMSGAGLSLSSPGALGLSTGIIRLQAGTSLSGAAGMVGQIHFGGSAFLELQAEL